MKCFPPATPVPLTLLMLLLAGAPSAARAAPMGCLIEPERITDVGSPVVGVIERIEVQRGQWVRRGQVLAVLRAGVERATLGVANTRAEGDADIKAASASAQFNRERLVRAEDLYRQQFISIQALEQTRTEAQLADQKLAQAREQRQISQEERGVAAAQLQQRVIRSPIDGVVAERFLTPGERVDDKPLLRLARVDPLRVQLVVPVGQYGQVQMGGLANVMPELPGAGTVQARVTMIDRVVDAASNTFRVQLELPNPNGALPAGLRCKAEFAGAAAAPLAAASAAALPPVPPAAAPVAAPPPAAPRAAASAPPAAGGAPRRAPGLALTLTLPPPVVAELPRVEVVRARAVEPVPAASPPVAELPRVEVVRHRAAAATPAMEAVELPRVEVVTTLTPEQRIAQQRRIAARRAAAVAARAAAATAALAAAERAAEASASPSLAEARVPTHD